MNKLTHVIIHCLATPEGVDYTKDQLAIMHLGPAIIKDKLSGKVVGYKYKGVNYSTISALPNERVGGLSLPQIIKIGGGKGWRQYGYNEMLHLNGEWETIVPYDKNGLVDPWEITNGLSSGDKIYFNALNLVYAGGMTKDMKAWKDTRTPEQNKGWISKIQEIISANPEIKVGGHNQYSVDRACPSFNVADWMIKSGFKEKNIDNEPMKFMGKLINKY